MRFEYVSSTAFLEFEKEYQIKFSGFFITLATVLASSAIVLLVIKVFSGNSLSRKITPVLENSYLVMTEILENSEPSTDQKKVLSLRIPWDGGGGHNLASSSSSQKSSSAGPSEFIPSVPCGNAASQNRRGIVPAVVRGLLSEATSDKKSADNYLAATPRSPVVKEEANLTKQERAEILRL